MNDKNKIQEQIDKYLLKDMTVEELRLFEEKMVNDSNLNENVHLQKMIIEEIIRKEDFFSLLDQPSTIKQKGTEDNEMQYDEADKSQGLKVHIQSNYIIEKNLEKASIVPLHKRRNIIWKTLSIAAVLIGLTLIVWQPGKLTNDNIIKIYSEDFEFSISERAKLLDETRSVDLTLMNFNSYELQLIHSSLQYVNDKKFDSASTSFENVNNLKERNNYLGLIMAISQIKSGKFEKASQNLEFLSRLTYFQYREASLFYLALTKVKSGQLKEARKIFRTLKTANGIYSKKSSEILHKMRYF